MLRSLCAYELKTQILLMDTIRENSLRTYTIEFLGMREGYATSPFPSGVNSFKFSIAHGKYSSFATS